MTPELIFHGGAGTVTGSCYELVRHAGGRLMIDCGMFQGNKTVRELNYRDVPIRALEGRCPFADPCAYRPYGLRSQSW